MTPTARRAGIACLCAGALLVTGGVALAVGHGGPARPPASVPLPHVGRVPAPLSPEPNRPRPPGRAPRVAGRLPSGSRLLVDGQAAPIGQVRVVRNEMQIPRDPRRVGWWRSSAVPGSPTGSVVIVGHVNYAGVTGVLAVLPDLRPGDRIVIAEAHHRYRYVVSGVRSYPKSAGLPGQVFARGGRSRLVLITCGGAFDSASGNYEDNIVAYAVPRA